MRPSLLLACAAALLPAVSAVAKPPEPPALGPGLTAALEGRTRGATRSCIALPRTGGTQIVNGEGIIYKQSGSRWYVNVPSGGRCTALRDNRTLITRTPSTQLCRGDIVRVADLNPYFEMGSCGLGDFVEYRRAPNSRSRP